MLGLSNNIPKIFYGENSEFDVYGKQFTTSEFVEFKWNTKNKSLESQSLVKTHMFGHYNFINLLCAACIGNYFKVSENDINEALAGYIPEMNRSQVKKTKTNTVILDAYNANPSSMSLAISNFQKQDLGSKIVILGDMLELGDYSKIEHQKILTQLEVSDFKKIYLVGVQFLSFNDRFRNYMFFKTVDELQEFLKNNNISDSTVLIKGSRGVRLEKIVELL